MTADQRRLANKHGTPAEFAVAVYKCVPGDGFQELVYNGSGVHRSRSRFTSVTW